MKKKNASKGSRSRRKSVHPPHGKVLEVGSHGERPVVRLELPLEHVVAGVRGAVEELAAQAGLLVMNALVEEEVERLVGRKGKHDATRRAVRWGHEEGYFVWSSRKVATRRPRVRGVDGGEVELERYRSFQSPRDLEASVGKRVLAGVATRDYRGVLDNVCDGYGIEKSSVSRHWKALSAEKLQAFLERPLGERDFPVLMIDGVAFDEYTLAVALGIDSTGRKQVLGVWLGGTENAAVAKSLLENLVERGLDPKRRRLIVIDGSKALRKAVRDFFGEAGLVQRCQVHKQRNVLSHLPERHHAAVTMRLRAAWSMKYYEDAKKELLAIVDYLDELNPSAARSLEEGLEETLTICRLEVPEALRRTLRSTNPIENCFSFQEKYCGNVKRWSSGEMVLRWSSAMLLEVEKRFRKIKGYQSFPLLLSCLERKIDSKHATA